MSCLISLPGSEVTELEERTTLQGEAGPDVTFHSFMSFISRPNIWSGVARGQTRIKHRFMKWVITINFHSIQGVVWCDPINANWWHRKKTNLCRNVFHSEFDDVRGIWLYRFNYWCITRVLSGQWSNPIQFNQFNSLLCLQNMGCSLR